MKINVEEDNADPSENELAGRILRTIPPITMRVAEIGSSSSNPNDILKDQIIQTRDRKRPQITRK